MAFAHSAPTVGAKNKLWEVNRYRSSVIRGFPRLILALLLLGLVMIFLLWLVLPSITVHSRRLLRRGHCSRVGGSPFPFANSLMPLFSVELWRFLPLGYLFTISIETPILVFGFSRRHSLKRKLLAGVWLTACTYPIVTLVLPLLFTESSRTVYLVVAEIFAPVGSVSSSGGFRVGVELVSLQCGATSCDHCR